MNKDNRGRNHDETTVSRFIDDLIEEQKPAAYRSGPLDPEMEKLFKTVRAVRRLKTSSRQQAKTFTRRRVKGWVALAAALLLVVLGLSTFQLPGLNLAWPGFQRGGTVQAAVKAYEELSSYSGVFEIRNEHDGAVTSLETIRIQYQKPNRYAAVHSFEGLEQRYVSDGDKLMSYEYERVTVDNLFPEKELWRYHIGTVIRELSEAETVETLGTEILFGRNAELLRYDYPGSSPGEYGQVWIDSATYLPLRKELFHPDGSVLVVEFKELAVNPQFEDETFAWTLPESKVVTELNRPGTLEQVKTAWPEVKNILPAVYTQMALQKTGVLDYDLFDYVLRFQSDAEYDFLDIYYTATPREFHFERHSKLGLLGDGYVELNPTAWNVFERYFGGTRTARWVTGDYEIFMVSNRSVDFLQSLLEELPRDTINFKTVQEMKTLGLQPVTEKEGH